MTRRSPVAQQQVLIAPALASEWLGRWEGADEDVAPWNFFASVRRDVSYMQHGPLAGDLPAGTWVRWVVDWRPDKVWILEPGWGRRLLERFGGGRGRCPITFTALETSNDRGATWWGHVFGVDLRPRLGWDPPMSAYQLRKARGGNPARCHCHNVPHARCPAAEPCIGGCGRLTTAGETPACGYCTHCHARPYRARPEARA